MMQPDKLNQQGFEGDKYIGLKIQELCETFKVETIIETGTFHGYTTLALHDIVPDVITIESQPEYQHSAYQKFAGKNIWSILAHSQNCLGEVIQARKGKSLLFFLDAHWEDACPLKDELRHIAEAGIKPVIAIHDWKVPGKDFGYDSYHGQAYETEWIINELKAIYGEDMDIQYNEVAEGHKRGVVYITPKVAKKPMQDDISGTITTSEPNELEQLQAEYDKLDKRSKEAKELKKRIKELQSK